MWGLLALFSVKTWIVIIVVGFVLLWILSRSNGTLATKIKDSKQYCKWQKWFASMAGESDDGNVQRRYSDGSTFSAPKMVSLRDNIPILGRSKSETLAINAFAQLIKARGGNINHLKIGCRPDFLVNPATKKNMELDAYFPDWKMALEYNGAQHYQFPNKYHPYTLEGHKEFVSTRQRDALKKELLEEYDICLITVPYHVDTCVECDKDPTGYRFKQHTDAQKWDRLVRFIDQKIDYCNRSARTNGIEY